MIKCPNCGKSHYTKRYSVQTAVYYPTVYQDGKVVSRDGNISTVHCTCIECHHDFTYQEQYGEVFNISDEGKCQNVFEIGGGSITVGTNGSLSIAATSKCLDAANIAVEPLGKSSNR